MYELSMMGTRWGVNQVTGWECIVHMGWDEMG